MSLVGMRDASWYSSPETQLPKRYHTASGGPASIDPRGSEAAVACCNTSIPLDSETIVPVGNAPPNLLCRRWPCVRRRLEGW